MKELLRNYFTFNKQERNGIFVLFIVIILLLTYLVVNRYPLESETVDFSDFQKNIAIYEEELVALESSKKKTPASRPIKEHRTINLFEFNPNGLTIEKWKQLGLSHKQIQVIKNYEVKGGRFRKKEDLQKIYSISEKQYSILAPYISIPSAKVEISTKYTNTSKVKVNIPVLIDINTASQKELIAISGVGKYYAIEIIKLRKRLGGFYKSEQLLEIYKLDSLKLKGIEKQIVIDATTIKKININTCTAKELKHSYLNWNQVNAIINYRNNHGNYNSVSSIKNSGVINEELFLKFSPYLVTQ